MEFRTKTIIADTPFSLDHSNPILLVGSCFSDNIGSKLKRYRFNCSINPFGVLFNPMSILNCLQRIQHKSLFTEDELMEFSGKWLSLDHHSSFSKSSKGECLSFINTNIANNHEYFKDESVLLITFGTAWVYEWEDTERIVGNCHKIPQNRFKKRLLKVDEIVEQYTSFLNLIKENYEGLKVIFTVSPVRHLKDGMRENQVSKSVLHLSVDQLNKAFDNTFYFPSYEILMDDLRDYRFYKSDLLHPNQMAVDYVWERFEDSLFTSETKGVIEELKKIIRGLEHKPFDSNSEEHQLFLKKLADRIQEFEKRNSNINLSELSSKF